MASKHATDSLQLYFMTDEADSDLEAMLEGTLEEDVEPFFFGCHVQCSTEEQLKKIKKDE